MAERQIIPGVPQFIDLGEDEVGFPRYEQTWVNIGGRKPLYVQAFAANQLTLGFLNENSTTGAFELGPVELAVDQVSASTLDIGQDNSDSNKQSSAWIAVGGVYAQISSVSYYVENDGNATTLVLNVQNRTGNYNSFHMLYNPVYQLMTDPR